MYALPVRIEVDHAKQFNYFFFLNKILQVKHKVDNAVPSMIMAMPITENAHHQQRGQAHLTVKCCRIFT